MGKIVSFFVERPILVNLIVLAVLGLGLLSAYSSRKEGFPEISLNKIKVQTIYPGASARDVEINVTVKIEDALEKVEGIQEVTSISEEGMSAVDIEADNDATPEQFRKLYNDVEQAVTEIDDLPADIDGKPTLTEFTSKDIPVLILGYRGEYEILKPYIDRLEKRLKRLPGVAFADVVGLPDREVQILVDPLKARARRVGLRTIFHSIQKRNFEGSGGTLESFTNEKKIVFLSKFKHYQDVLDTNIVTSDEGRGVKLKDVATVELQPEDLRLIVRNNGERGAVLSIRKTGTSDLIKVVDSVHDLLAQEKLPEGVSATTLLDQSSFTRDRIQLLVGNAAMGFVLVTLILFAVFNARTALWTSFGVPFTLLFLVVLLKQIGVSLNLISLGGFIIIIGMLVDDAIVIAEEISHNKEIGLGSKEAAVKAVQKMWIPVTGAVTTTMIAFSPILAIGGFPGKFIWAIPLMVILGLCISLFESFFILPAHLCHGKPRKEEKKRFVLVLEEYYRRLLSRALRYRYPVAGVFVLLLVGSILILRVFVVKDPFPQQAAEGFTISLTAPRGTSSAETEQILERAEKILLELPAEELLGISSRVGTHSESAATDRGSQSNIAIIFAYLHPYSGRDRTAEEIMVASEENIRAALDLKPADLTASLTRIGPPLGKPFEIRLIANDDARRNSARDRVIAFLETVDGIHGVSTDEVAGKDEINIVLDYDTLARTGLNAEDVLSTLRIAFDGQIVTFMTTLESELNFRLRLNEPARQDPEFIKRLPVANARGNLINLGAFSELEEQPSQAKFNHVNGVRSVTIFGNTDLSKQSPVDVMNLVRREFADAPGVELSFSGQPVETQAIFGDLTAALLVAVLGIYLVIALILNSYARPLVIMTPLPFIVIGVAFALITHGLPLSMLAGVALVGLMGVVVNDSIVMVYNIEEQLAGSFDLQLLIEGAVSRMRPVLLTTITTVFGVLPTGYGWGGYDPFLSQMCIVTAYGLMFSSLIILFLVPIVYHMIHDLSGFLRSRLGTG